jgi:hypothetical protein
VKIAPLLAISIVATAAHAQTVRFEGQATWWWEASADGGATWSASTLEVPQSQGTVRVRTTCSFPPVFGYYLGGAAIDQRITGVSNAGLNDTLSILNVGIMSVQTFAARRFGNILKIDDVSDTLPPGEGSAHLFIGQPNPSIGPYTLANPITNLVVFDLHLDGSAGDRFVDAWWRDWTPNYPQIPPGPRIHVRNRDLADPDIIVPDLTVNPLTIRVIPAPGAVAVLAAFGFAVGRRRRRDQRRVLLIGGDS